MGSDENVTDTSAAIQAVTTVAKDLFPGIHICGK